MAIYRARWFCPERLKAMFRDFHSKREAEAFQSLPRGHAVLLERCADLPIKDDHRT